MYDQEWRRTRHWIGFGILALVAIFVIGVLVFLFVVAARAVTVGTYPVFPFGFGWIWFFLIFFLFFGLFRLIFWPWRWGYRGYYRGYGRYGDTAYDILRERYARGEITKDQYDAMMRDLYQNPRTGP
jgi:putative membrane protein